MEKYSVFAPDQTYTKKFLNEIKKKDLVIYDHPINFSMYMYWTDSLIKQLIDAKLYWEEIKHKYE